MSEIAKRLNQCRKPAGELGRLVVDDMNESHYNLTGCGLDKVDIRKEDLILDVGCGGGKTVSRMAQKAVDGKVFGMDYSDDCVKWSIDLNIDLIQNNKVEIFQGSVEQIPFQNEYFDLITAVETLYFWPDIKNNFIEIRRVLKKTGTFLIINEMYESKSFEERNKKFQSLGNMNIFSPEELKQLLTEAGFKEIKIDLIEEKNWICCICK